MSDTTSCCWPATNFVSFDLHRLALMTVKILKEELYKVKPHTHTQNPTWVSTVKHQILMSGYGRKRKSTWAAANHLRGRPIVPLYPAEWRILLLSHKVAVRLLKEIALLAGHWLTPRIARGNTHLGSCRHPEKPDHQVQYLLWCYCFTHAYGNIW